MAKFFLRLALLSLVMSGAACEDTEISMMILQMQPIESCKPADSPDSFQSQGVIDIAFVDSYSVFPLLQNKMLDSKEFSGDNTRTNTNDVLLRQAVVEYEFVDPISGDFDKTLTAEMSGFVPIGDDGKVVGVELMPLSLIERLRAAPEMQTTDGQVQIIATVRIKGETLSGRAIETNEFQFPVIACLGCRLKCSQQEMDLLASTENASSELECPEFAGQDNNFVDCLSCTQLVNESIQANICPTPRGAN